MSAPEAWLKAASPGKAPPEPAEVNYEAVMGALQQAASVGIDTPANAYLRLMAPQQEVDDWGQPQPLAPIQQYDFDRLVAILRAPFERGTALLHAGQLAPDEVDAIVAVFPDVYEVMFTQAERDVIDAGGPPLPDWSENVLGVLFRKPASAVYTGEKGDGPDKTSARTFKPTPATQAERRDIGIRAGGR